MTTKNQKSEQAGGPRNQVFWPFHNQPEAERVSSLRVQPGRTIAESYTHSDGTLRASVREDQQTTERMCLRSVWNGRQWEHKIVSTGLPETLI